MLHVASRLISIVGLPGLLLAGALAPAVSSAAVPLSTGWSSVDMGPPASYRGPVSPPFYVVRGGPGLVAISAAVGGGNAPSVWVSADGRNWQYKPLDRPSFANVSRLSAPALGKHGLVMVGTAQGAPSSGHAPLPQGVVWTSTTGLSWQRIPTPGTVFQGASLSSVTAGGPGYVAVGTVQTRPSPTPTTNYRSAIWVSSDGARWYPASDAGPRFRAAFITDVAAGGPGLVAVGSAYSAAGRPQAPAIWTSTNGRSWRRLPLNAPFGKGEGIDRIVRGHNELLALGYDTPARGLHHQIVWTSPDGLHWRRAATDPFGVGHSAPAVTALGSGFTAVGQYDNAPTLWWSADGSWWTPAAGSDVFGGGLTALANAVMWRNGLLVVGEHADPPLLSSSPAGRLTASKGVAWLWTPGAANAPHPNWAATDPQWFRLRLADLGPRFIPRWASYGMGCELIPDVAERAEAPTRVRPAVDTGFDRTRCERALAALEGSLAYNFNFGYGAANLNGPEPEVTGFAVLARDAAQSRAAYQWGDGIVIAADLNLNAGNPHPEGNVKVADGGTLYSIATRGFGTAYAVVWRAGRALGMVEVLGVPGDAKARAIALARTQWNHWKAATR